MLSRALVWLFLWPFVKVRVAGLEEMRKAGAFLLAGNHISHFDPPFLTMVSPRKIDWMAMAELFENKLLARWLRSVDTFPVDRHRVDRTAVKVAIAKLRAGHVVGMFPEGGIRDGEASMLYGAPGRGGIGTLAYMADVPVIPFVILGSDKMYAKSAWNPFRKTEVWIAFGAPIQCGSHEKGDRIAFEGTISASIRQLFAMMRDRFQLTEADMPQRAGRRKGREVAPANAPVQS